MKQQGEGRKKLMQQRTRRFETDKKKEIQTNEARSYGTGSSLEFAIEISLTSLGSIQTFPFPHLSRLPASRFCNLSDTISPPLTLLPTPTRRNPGKEGRSHYIVPSLGPRLRFLGTKETGLHLVSRHRLVPALERSPGSDHSEVNIYLGYSARHHMSVAFLGGVAKLTWPQF